RYKKNLAQVVVLEPSSVLHTFFAFARLFLSPKFYKKLWFCETVGDLRGLLPEFVIKSLPKRVVQGRRGAPCPSPASCKEPPSPAPGERAEDGQLGLGLGLGLGFGLGHPMSGGRVEDTPAASGSFEVDAG
ncbi:unnamed protein product, partial [Discosporangium mesarthrocarpum]